MTATEAVADVITIVPAEVQARVMTAIRSGNKVSSIVRTTRLSAVQVRTIGMASGWAYEEYGKPMLPPAPPRPASPVNRAGAARIALDYLQKHRGGREAEDLSWQDQALCAQTDPEAFFPEKGGGTRAAKKVCRSCEVRAECLEYALEHDERFGIWGGLSERERRRLKRQGVAA